MSAAATAIEPRGSHATSAARAAGLVLAIAYLSGVVDATLLSLAGALVLVSGGRALASDRQGALASGVGFVLITASLGAAALRWSATSLHEWREIQSVLGSPIALEPQAAAIACGLAAGAGLLGLVLWLSATEHTTRADRAISIVEGAVVSAALVTAFWGAGAPDEGGAEIALAAGRWVGLTLLGAGVSFYLASLLRRRRPRDHALVGALAVALAVAGLALLAGEL